MHDHAIQCIHDPMLVALSYLVAVLGSYTALQLAIGIPAARNQRDRTQAVLASGAAMGGAIWAMHFIAMLACQMDVQVTYDLALTVLSAVIAMVSCMVGLGVAGSGVFAWSKLGLGGLFMGLGVAGMHYTGMAAMRMAATVHYDSSVVAISVVIAVVASCAALWLAFNMRGAALMLGSALVMGVAVCGMHYTGMAAASFTPTQESVAAATAGGIGGQYLGATIFVLTTVMLATVLAVSLVRQQRRALVRI
ncbi:MHYT domain-containing protein [Dokdonella sp.]|uniref:MHYT domain-containing protein n=1 Tax=Dokdonella sp. TaxID=2291710 RepID=UPI00262DBF60|nr:MHYT domain-containing protein [Dokdonella sp.]